MKLKTAIPAILMATNLSMQGQILADFAGSTPGTEGVGNVDLPANLDAGTVGAQWSLLSTTGGEVTVTTDTGGLSSGTRHYMDGNYLFIGKKVNDATHSSTATLTLDAPQALAGTTFSVDAEMDNSGAQASKGLMVDVYDGSTLLLSLTFGNSTNIGPRYSIGELDASDALVQDLFSTTAGSRVWEANDTGASVTINLGATDYTVGAISESNGDLGLSSVLSYLNPATTFDKIVFTADRSKASWSLDNITVGAVAAKLQADSPQQYENSGTAETLLIPFSNTGESADLSITGVTLTAGNTSFFTTPTIWTDPVAPNGGSGTISLPFDPTSGGPGPYTVDLEVASNSVSSPHTITVNVEVIDPFAVVTPTAVDFGTDTATFTMNVNIENTGSQETLNINSISVLDDADGVFSVGTYPATLAPGANVDVPVTYAPGATTGYLTATLEIDTDGYDQSTFLLPISALETGAPISNFLADFESSFADASAIAIPLPLSGWMTTAANLSLGSIGGGWSNVSTGVLAPSTQFTGVGVSDENVIATGMTGNWLLFGNTGNTQPEADTNNANTYASIELDTPIPLVDGTSFALDMVMLNSGGGFGQIQITGKDSSGTPLFQIGAGNGGTERYNLFTASDSLGTVDSRIEDVWANQVTKTVELYLNAADYTATADGGGTTIPGSYLAAGSLATIEFHARDSKALWGIDNIKVEQPVAVKLQAASPQVFDSDGTSETLFVDFANFGISSPLTITGITLGGADAASFTQPTTWTSPVAANGGTGTIELPFDGASLDGTYEVTLTVDSNDTLNPSKDINVTVNVTLPPGYSSWAAGFVDLTDSDPELDFEGDGLETGLEWVVGGDPTVNDAAGIAPTFDNTSDPDNFLYTYRRTLDALLDEGIGTTIVVEYGSNLTSWHNTADDGAADGVVITEVIDGAGTDIDLVTVAIPRVLATDGTLGTEGKMFVRLRVDITP